MKIGKFSIATMLLVTAVLGMAVHIYMQGKTLIQLQAENLQSREELGKFDDGKGGSILVRPLLNRGPNTWRYRIYKEGEGFQYGFGIVNVDKDGSLILPPGRNRVFQWMPSEADGEVEFVLSIVRSDENSDWYYTVSEYPEYGVKSSAVRLNMLTFDTAPAVWNFKPPVSVVNDLPEMMQNGRTNGQVCSFDKSETVVLFRSESPVPTGETHQAFVVVIQKISEN